MRYLVAAKVPAAVLLAAIVLAPSASRSQLFDECNSTAAVSCPGMRVSMCPRGDFEDIKYGCGGGTDYIEVIIKDQFDQGVPSIPWTDYWIGACDEQYGLAYCVDHIVADSLTGYDGRTTFSGLIAAGGCIPEGGIWIACQGMTLLTCDPFGPICLDVVLVSPDLNADGLVNLSDLTFFGQSYNKSAGDPGYDTCCDYNDDDTCNLSDFSFFSEHYQHRCM